MNTTLVRYIEWYKKEGNTSIVGSEDITHIEVEFFKNDLHIVGDDNDPDLLYAVYDVPEEHAQKLQPFVQHKIDLEKYDYFIGCYTKK